MEIPGMEAVMSEIASAVEGEMYSTIENEGLVEGQPWLINDIENTVTSSGDGFTVTMTLVNSISGNSNEYNYAMEQMYLSNLNIRAQTLIGDTVNQCGDSMASVCQEYLASQVSEALL